MLLKCPSCGARCSAEAWENDNYTVKSLTIAAKLPASIGEHALQYMAMFRDPNASRPMTWQKVFKRLQELESFVSSGTVDCKGRTPIKCTSEIWGKALERIKERNLKLPLNNHRYLKAIAYELAEEKGKVKAQHYKIIQGAVKENPKPKKGKGFQIELTPEQQEAFDQTMITKNSEYRQMFSGLNDFEKGLSVRFGENSKAFLYAMKREYLKLNKEQIKCANGQQ